MDLVITINEKDLVNNPNIMDAIKTLAMTVSGKNEPEKTKAPQDTTQAVRIPGEDVEESQEDEPQAEEIQEEPLTEPQYSIEEVRKALGELSKAKGTATAKAVLQGFKVAKVTDLEPQYYDDVMLAIKAVK